MAKPIMVITLIVLMASAASAQGVWTAMTSPVTTNLNDVSLLPDGSAWAVGQTGTVLRFDGSTWTAEETPITEDLNAVFGLSGTEVWTVGNSGAIYAYDGSDWTRAEGIDPNYSFYDLALDPTGTLWVCGSEFLSGGIVMRLMPAGDWELFASRPTGLRKMDIPRAGEIWAVGGGDMVHHYARNSWQSLTTGTGDTLFAVQAAVDGTVWVTGSRFSDGRQHIFRYTGADWEKTHEDWGEWLLDIQMLDEHQGFVVGQEGKVMRWDGEAWTNTGPVGTRTLNALDMTSAYYGIAVGDRGTIFQFSQPSIDVNTSKAMFQAGDTFELTLVLGNPGPVQNVDLYVILDVYSSYFFFPNWTPDVGFENRTLVPDSETEETLLEFVWPTGAGAADGIVFYAAILDAGTMNFATDFDFAAFGFR